MTPEIVAGQVRRCVVRDDNRHANHQGCHTAGKDEQIYEPFRNGPCIQYSTSADGRERHETPAGSCKGARRRNVPDGDANVHVDAWCSEPDDLLVYRMSSDAPIDEHQCSPALSSSNHAPRDGNSIRWSSGHTRRRAGRMPGLNIGLLPHPSENRPGKMSGTELEWRTPVRCSPYQITGGDVNVGDNSLQCSNITGLSLCFREYGGRIQGSGRPASSRNEALTVIADHLENPTIDEWSTDLADHARPPHRGLPQIFDRVAIHLGSAHDDDTELPFSAILRSDEKKAASSGDAGGGNVRFRPVSAYLLVQTTHSAGESAGFGTIRISRTGIAPTTNITLR